MHRTTALLLWMALWMPLAGAVYFCGLVLDAPLVLVIVISVVLGGGLALGTNKLSAATSAPPLTKRTGLLLVAGIATLSIACAFLSRRYGDWDAALIWNLHARYLAAGEAWRGVYEPGASGNAAYPLGLPSIIALLWKTLNTQSQTLPFLVALIPTLGIPVVIFLEGARGKVWIGAAVLALFGLHRYYLALGLDQYADIQVAWLWLLAAVCILRAQTSSQRVYWVAAGVLLGALCWTKWDGVLLTACLLTPQIPQFFRQPRTFLLLLLGLAPFLLVILLFLQTGPPRAPLLMNLEGFALRAVDGQRYRLIASGFATEAVSKHWPLAAILLATPVFWWKRATPTLRRLYASVVAAVIGYAAVYLLLVSTDLNWNLQFSLPRLLLQVYPLAVFVAASAAALPERRFALQ